MTPGDIEAMVRHVQALNDDGPDPHAVAAGCDEDAAQDDRETRTLDREFFDATAAEDP